MKGLNIQGCVRSQIHPKGTSYTQMIERCANVIKDLNVESIRIGGTPMEGAIFDEDVPGYGSPHTDYGDNYNYPIAFLDVCQAAGINNVFISLHAMYENKLTVEDLQSIRQYCKMRGINEVAFGLDNEPYSPNRMSGNTTDYQWMRDMHAHLRSLNYTAAWPLVYASSQETVGRTRRREAHTSQMLTPDVLAFGDNVFEVHLYCPPTTPPKDFLADTLNETNAMLGKFGVGYDKEIIIGEWSGKNQEVFSDSELENIIKHNLNVFSRRNITHYYQLLGGKFDEQGLFNFLTGTPNRGYEIFKNG